MRPDKRLTRRRMLATGGGLALAASLPQLVVDALASAPPVAVADDRPAMAGRAPVLFVGHGSPLNAVADNRFTRTLHDWGRALGTPQAILVVSAHWLTERITAASAALYPETLHDFGGFPAQLHKMQYPAPGASVVARRLAARVAPAGPIGLDERRGLDHGAWTVLWHLYPAANVPVFQLSIDIARPAAYHLAVGRAMSTLRDEGVLILGSGNVVHNLFETDRQAPEGLVASRTWAQDFDLRVKQALDDGNRQGPRRLRAPHCLGIPGRADARSLLPAALRARRSPRRRSAAPCARGVPVRHPQHALPPVGMKPPTQ